MAIQLSPGVVVTERDFTNVVPAVASSACAVAGAYRWGPVSSPVTITSENELVARFGKPNDLTAQSFFTAANYLAYSANLLNVRVDTVGQRNAVAFGPAVKVKNLTHYQVDFENTINPQIFAAKYPGILGNSIGVHVADVNTFTGTVLTGNLTTIIADSAATPPVLATSTLSGSGTQFLTELYVGATLKNTLGIVVGTILSIESNTAATFTKASTIKLTAAKGNIDWKYASQFQASPSTTDWAISKGALAAKDEIHVLIIDSIGEWTGVPGAILEKYSFLSKASNSKNSAGTNNYYKEVLNTQSKYVWAMTKLASDWDTDLNSTTVYSTLTSAISLNLAGGVDDFVVDDGDLMDAYSLFVNDVDYQIAYIAAGKASSSVATFIIDNVATVREDVIVFISPEDVTTGDILMGNTSEVATSIIAYRNGLPSTSFAVIDTGYKYQYDRYSDKYRWVPLNGDIAGLCARTDVTNDPWFSPGGFNRGQIKNVVKLAYNPNKADRDALYSKGINPVVSFPGQGVVLYGDKTLLSKPSAFDRIGVRRLFIILEKSISIAAQYQLFDFNDSFTQAQFKNMIIPFLRNIKGRRGISDYQVICDSTNNTPEVVSTNNFIADIYIQPNYSINFIQLNFIATAQGVSFSTVGGV